MKELSNMKKIVKMQKLIVSKNQRNYPKDYSDGIQGTSDLMFLSLLLCYFELGNEKKGEQHKCRSHNPNNTNKMKTTNHRGEGDTNPSGTCHPVSHIPDNYQGLSQVGVEISRGSKELK